MTLGGFEATRQEFLISPAEELARLTRGIDGVLGQAFLSLTDYWLDLRHKTLTLGAAEAQGERVPFERSHGRMLVETSHGRLILDSGADALVLNEMVLQDDGRNGVLSRLTTATGSAQVRTASVDVMVGERRFYDVTAALVRGAKADETDPDGLLPVKLLSSVYVSNSGEYVVLNPQH